jgi:hypothetical protein
MCLNTGEVCGCALGILESPILTFEIWNFKLSSKILALIILHNRNIFKYYYIRK